jgi:hypothetical protein
MDNKTVQYNEVVAKLMKDFPDFQFDQEDSELPYLVAGSFAVYLHTCYINKLFDEMYRGFDFIEELHVNGDSQTKELATIGFLEDLQNYFSRGGANPEDIFEYLGNESKKWWVQLNEFWQGRIPYVGATIDV